MVRKFIVTFLVPRNLSLLDIALQSKLPLQIRYALDSLLTISAEYSLRFQEYPQLLSTLVSFAQDSLSIPKLNKGSIVKQEKRKGFLGYKELFEADWTILFSVQGDCVSTISQSSLQRDYSLISGMILRNTSLLPDNQVMMGGFQPYSDYLLSLLDLPAPDHVYDLLDGTKDEPISSVTPTGILEHRKNALISLAALGHCISLPNVEKLNQIIEMCIDFIQVENSPYVYPAVDCLARLLINPKNQNLFGSAERLSELVQCLLKLLPSSGFYLSAPLPQLAEWELSLMIIGSLIGLAEDDIQAEIFRIPKFSRIMFNLCRRPPAHGLRPGVGQEVFGHLQSLRERSLRALLASLKYRKGGMTKKWEQELLEYAIIMHQQGEPWIATIIFQEISSE
jgi:hypothetical protein